MLHGDRSVVGDQLIEDVTEYLNEYDESSNGLWLAATHTLIHRVSADTSNRRLVGLPDLQSQEEAHSDKEMLNALCALIQKGHVVSLCPGNGCDQLQTHQIFHAGIGTLSAIQQECHITLNPERINPQSIPSIIADVFLEWMNCKDRTSTGPQILR